MRGFLRHAVKFLRDHPFGNVHKRFRIGVLVSDFGKLFVLPIDENVFGSGFKSGFGDYVGELAAFYGGVDDENLTLLQVYAYFDCQTCELFLFFVA